jgi:hypothetical protein
VKKKGVPLTHQEARELLDLTQGPHDESEAERLAAMYANVSLMHNPRWNQLNHRLRANQCDAAAAQERQQIELAEIAKFLERARRELNGKPNDE